MVANLSWFPMDNKVPGIALQSTQTVVNSQGSGATALSAITGQTGYELPAAGATVGDHIQGNNNSLWLFVKASSTVTAGNAVMWDTNFNANNATTTLGVINKGIGIAQFYTTGLGPGSIQSTLQQGTAQPGDFFWIATQGQGLVVNLTATASANDALFLVTGSPGQLSVTAATAAVKGLFTGSASAVGVSGTNNSTTDAFSETPMIVSV
jgi:hypothetical protein